MIKELLSNKEKDNPKTNDSFVRMEDFARDGLRTLVLAGRDLERLYRDRISQRNMVVFRVEVELGWLRVPVVELFLE